ncbi:conserved hypothetical protein [Trichinella spiralis]|uniref:hypothetical protein n=1 Tax=Trichinella spiralis TaxID=6334 RepID=UPI0001EFEF07|nr:conserved hypothetical protein [Trichinella spiralis]
MDNILRVEELKDGFVFVDNVTICGMNQEEHGKNLNRIREVAEKYNLTLNKDKSSLRRVLRMFAAYSQWIPRFSEKIHALARCTTFPLPQPAVYAFKAMTNDIVNSVVTAIDDELPFTVETDASDHAIAATLSQLGKPVSFFSRMLSHGEQRHSSVEKEAYGIVKVIRKWQHYLLRHHFHLITDQRSVAIMFNNKQAGNGQAGRYNGIIRKAVSLALRSHNLRIEQWEEVIRLALHLLRRLLSTATNATPHERLFGSSSRTPTDTSLPTWLTTPGMVLMRRLSQTNNRNLLVEELELLEVNPKYAHVRLTD